MKNPKRIAAAMAAVGAYIKAEEEAAASLSLPAGALQACSAAVEPMAAGRAAGPDADADSDADEGFSPIMKRVQEIMGSRDRVREESGSLQSGNPQPLEP